MHYFHEGNQLITHTQNYRYRPAHGQSIDLSTELHIILGLYRTEMCARWTHQLLQLLSWLSVGHTDRQTPDRRFIPLWTRTA